MTDFFYRVYDYCDLPESFIMSYTADIDRMGYDGDSVTDVIRFLEREFYSNDVL